eukprot:9260492-Karenia_brevis.AAC.1
MHAVASGTAKEDGVSLACGECDDQGGWCWLPPILKTHHHDDDYDDDDVMEDDDDDGQGPHHHLYT